jgi:hypothetical protein
MENGMATEHVQQECITIDDDDGESKATIDGKEATAFYTEHASDYSALEQNVMDATDSYDDSIDALLDVIFRVRIFNTVYINSYQVQSKEHGI